MSATDVLFSLAGNDVTSRVLWGSCSIQDALNATPNTARLTMKTTAPVVGQVVRIGLGDFTTPNLLFAGTVQAVDESYLDKYQNTIWPFTCVDWTFTLNKRRPFGTWVNVSATTIAQSIVSTYAPGFTSVGVEAALPTVSIIFDGSDDFMSCLGRLAAAVNGYADVDYSQDVKLFITDVSTAPDPIDAAHPPLNDPPITYSMDWSQGRTKGMAKGHGEATPSDVTASESIIPIADAVMFNPLGGKAIAGTTPDGAQSQILDYTGVQLSVGGSLAGPGATPSTAPTLEAVPGSGLSVGVYQYAYTDVTPAGESLPSPLGSITITSPPSAIADPTVSPSGAGGTGVSGTVGPPDNIGTGTTPFYVGYAYTWVTANGETVASPRHVLGHGSLADVTFYYYAVGPTGTIARKVYRTAVTTFAAASTDPLKYAGIIPDNTTTTYTDALPVASLGAAPPGSNTTGQTRQQVAITGVAIGASPTTSRKLYRTVADGSQLKLQQTVANNTATVGVQDATADGSLGANAPTSDTSGLTFAGGQVNAGSTSLLTASAGPFASGGGWVLLSSGDVIRYTGITGNTLTGIPASGPGAMFRTVLYGSQVLPAPALTGVTGLALAMQRGTKVSIWVERNDVAAQLALIAREGGGAGIVEYLITDERRGEASLTALLDADLAKFSMPLVSVSYATHDPKTRSGKTVAIGLVIGTWDVMFDPAVFGDLLWGLSGSFTIQSVDITFEAATIYPSYTVKAASVNFAFLDLIRRVPLAA